MDPLTMIMGGLGGIGKGLGIAYDPNPPPFPYYPKGVNLPDNLGWNALVVGKNLGFSDDALISGGQALAGLLGYGEQVGSDGMFSLGPDPAMALPNGVTREDVARWEQILGPDLTENEMLELEKYEREEGELKRWAATKSGGLYKKAGETVVPKTRPSETTVPRPANTKEVKPKKAPSKKLPRAAAPETWDTIVTGLGGYVP